MSQTDPRPIASSLVVALVILAGGLGVPEKAAAQQTHMPRIGQQFFATGLTLQPGFLYDQTSPEAERWNTISPTGAGMLRLGFHQILTESFMMSGEADLGLQWFNEHTAQSDGQADSEMAFGWQAAIIGRWMPFGERAGWALGGGPHWFNAYLADEPLQSLGVDLRAGRYLWKGTEKFVLLEIGYSVPLIQGLRRETNYSTETASSGVAKNWTFHRFSLSVQYGF